jgi:PKD repeat protein
LYIKHLPLLGEQAQLAQYDISAEIIAYSGSAIYADSVKIYYKVNGGAYSSVTMLKTTGNTYTGTIPGQAPGAQVAYYLQASDQSGRTSNHPYIGSPDPHVFTVSSTTPGAPVAQFTANTTTVSIGGSVTFTDQSTNTPTSWSWSFTGGTPLSSSAQNPVITYNTAGTYTVSLTAANAYGSDTETKAAYITVTDMPTGYCTSASTNYSDEWIASVTIGSMTNASGGSFYTHFSSKIVSLTKGSATSVSLTPGFAASSYTEYWGVWIDYNRDGDLADSGEAVFSSSGSTTRTGSFTVPGTASTGYTLIRVSMKYGSAPTYCGTFTYGEVEDYTANISGGSGNPPVANFTSDITTVTRGGSVQFTDTSTNTPTSWSWTFTGGTPSTSTARNPLITYNTVGVYTVALTATNAYGSNTNTKTNYITVTDTTITYCTSASTNTADEWIAGVTIANMTNTSTASYYTDFTAKVANLTRGTSASLTLTPGFSGSAYTEYWKVWIDYNRNGLFSDSGENVYSGSGTTARTGSFTPPTSALTGATRIRVSMKYGSAPTYCGTFTYGEVEDYTANIL